MLEKRPFIKKFQVGDSSYIYDVNTNRIFLVDAVVFDLVSHIYSLSRAQICEKYKNKYSGEEVDRALSEILAIAKQVGAFRPARPLSFSHQPGDQIQEALSHFVNSITLEVTEACNLRCKYCIYSDHYDYSREYSNKKLDFETARAAIDFLYNHNSKASMIGVSFYGGEPLIAFDLIKQCLVHIKRRYSERLPDVYNITTNGTLLTQKIVDFLVLNNFRILVSLDGPLFIHDKCRVKTNGIGTYNQIYSNLINLKARYPEFFRTHLSFASVLTDPHDVMLINEFFASDPLFDDFTPLVHISGPVIPNLPFPSDVCSFPPFKDPIYDYNLEQFIRRSREGVPAPVLTGLFGRSVGAILSRKVSPLEGSIYPNAMCIPGLTKLFVSTDGSLHMCEKVNSRLSIGHVNTGFDLDRISTLMEEYSRLCNEHCAGCWAVRLCRACFANCDGDGELSASKKEASCRSIKQSTDRALKAYCSIYPNGTPAPIKTEDCCTDGIGS